MQMKYQFLAPPSSSSPLRKLVALIMTAALVGLVLMFSAVLLVIIMIVGAIAWAYLWWKTRELRKQMRDFHTRATERAQKASNDEVFEGEVIRVVDPRNER
jgi:threonine/homoserine/homoserine lactone efflux protein